MPHLLIRKKDNVIVGYNKMPVNPRQGDFVYEVLNQDIKMNPAFTQAQWKWENNQAVNTGIEIDGVSWE